MALVGVEGMCIASDRAKMWTSARFIFVVKMTSYGSYTFASRDPYLAKVKYMLQCMGIYLDIMSISGYLPTVRIYQSR
jgi:hypothetical protein